MSRPGENTLRLLLAPIAAALADPTVREIVINRPCEIGIERGNGWIWQAVPELSFERLDATMAGGATVGYCAIGRPLTATAPEITRNSAITHAKMGRSMKN